MCFARLDRRKTWKDDRIMEIPQKSVDSEKISTKWKVPLIVGFSYKIYKFGTAPHNVEKVLNEGLGSTKWRKQPYNCGIVKKWKWFPVPQIRSHDADDDICNTYTNSSHIAISIAHILPNAVSLIAGSWALGDTLCHIKPYIGYYLFPANPSLICILTTGKSLLLTRRARYLSRIKAHLICSIVWITSLAYPGLMCILGKEDVSFDYRTYSCEYGWNSPTWKKVKPVMFPVLIAIVPNAIMITTTVPTLKYLVAVSQSTKVD